MRCAVRFDFAQVARNTSAGCVIAAYGYRILSAFIASFQGNVMDLGIRGRTAIVCASSQGLGKGCAQALAEAGANLVINGRNQALLEQTAEELRQAWSVSVTPVLGDVSTAAGQAALLKACPTPDILINNNGGPPVRNFRELDREAMLNGLTMNMVTPIELIQKVIDSM